MPFPLRYALFTAPHLIFMDLKLVSALGTVLVVFFSDPMVNVLADLAARMGIPSFYVAFVLAPLVCGVGGREAAESEREREKNGMGDKTNYAPTHFRSHFPQGIQRKRNRGSIQVREEEERQVHHHLLRDPCGRLGVPRDCGVPS